MVYQYDASIIGGDLRQHYLSSMLEQSGYKVITFGLETDLTGCKLNKANSMNEAMESSKIVIAPIPFSKDKKNITSISDVANMRNTDLSITNFLENLKPHHFLIGGNIPKEAIEMCNKKNIPYLDLMKVDEIALFNAVATAEGAIAEAINKSNINLHLSKCLVLGYGKCGKVLSSKLRALGSNVTVAARKEEALAEAYTNCHECINLTKDNFDIHDFDFIFNTIPSLILNKEALLSLSDQTVIIDIASAPGGLDYEFAKEIKLNAFLCFGIPGKVAPKSSAKIIAAAILPILKERSD